MMDTLLGIGLMAVAFMAVAYVRIHFGGGCGGDCGSCERACLEEKEHGTDDE